MDSEDSCDGLVTVGNRSVQFAQSVAGGEPLVGEDGGLPARCARRAVVARHPVAHRLIDGAVDAQFLQALGAEIAALS
jgi:hypothetical protein